MFYDNFINLCNRIGKPPTTVILEVGLNRAAATAWKKGVVPRDATLAKLADYFGITVDELMGKTKAVSNSDTANEDQLMAAFFEGGEDLSQEEMEELWADARDYIQYKLAQRRKKHDGQ